MFKSLILILLFLTPFINYAQITIESNTLPEIGDVLEYVSFDGISDTTTFRLAGEDVTWSFDNVDATGPIFTEEFSDIVGSGLDTLFPDANMVVSLDMFPAAAVRDANSIKILGIGGEGLTGGFLDIEINADTRFEDPYIYRQTPINYGDSFDDSFSLSISLSTDSIPFLDSIPLPIPGAGLDSLRITIENSFTETATGWGTVEISGNEIEVLKTEVEETSATGIEIGISVLGFFTWLDASDFLDTEMFAPQGETTTHKFLSADSKASIIEFTETIIVDSLGTETTVDGIVKSDLVTSTKDELIEAHSLLIYPQPADDILTIVNQEVDLSRSEIIIVDNSGRIVSRTSNEKNQISIDVKDYPAGIYTLLRISEKGIAAKRISIAH